MFKNSVVVMCTGALAGSLLVAAPSGAFAAEVPAASATATTVVKQTSIVDDLLSDQFEECPTTDVPAPKTSALGENLGSGITEELTPKMLATINESRVAIGKAPLGKNVKAMRYFDSGRIATLNANGKIVSEVSSANSVNASTQYFNGILIAQPASAKTEIKRFIKACFGIGVQGASTIEALIQELATPKNAVKFIVRRLGWFGAISCLGGVIYEYI